MTYENTLSDLSQGRVILSLRWDEVPQQYREYGYVPHDSVIFVTHQLDNEGGIVSSLQVNNYGIVDIPVWPGVHTGFNILDTNGKNSVENIGVNWIDPKDLDLESLNQTIVAPLAEGVWWVTPDQHMGSLAQLGEADGGVSVQLTPLKGFDDNSQTWAWSDNPSIFYMELAARGEPGKTDNSINIPPNGKYIFAWRTAAYTNPMA